MGRKLSVPLAAVVLFAFFLPWLQIVVSSCGRTYNLELSGYDMATDIQAALQRQIGPVSNYSQALTAPSYPRGTPARSGAQSQADRPGGVGLFLVVPAAAAMAVILGLATWQRRPTRALGLWSGAALLALGSIPLAAVFYLMDQLQKALKDAANSAGGLVSIQSNYMAGYGLTIIGLAGIAVCGLLELGQSARSTAESASTVTEETGQDSRK